MDQFASVFAGTLSPAQFFDPAHIGQPAGSPAWTPTQPRSPQAGLATGELDSVFAAALPPAGFPDPHRTTRPCAP